MTLRNVRRKKKKTLILHTYPENPTIGTVTTRYNYSTVGSLNSQMSVKSDEAEISRGKKKEITL